MKKQFTDKPHFVVKSMYLCRYLQQQGFELQKARVNKFNPLHNVYLFKDTEELRKAVSDHRAMKQAKREQQEG